MTPDESSTVQDQPGGSEGRPDLSGYSADQLRDLLRDELLRREKSGGADSPTTSISGRFSRRDGLLGWLESLLRRQPLYGRGSINADRDTITLHGWQRTWLMVPVERALSIAADRVRNVTRLGTGVYLEIRRRGWFSRPLVFEPDAGVIVEDLLVKLPATKTSSFTTSRQDLLAFEQALREKCSIAWVTPLVVLLNVAAFVALAIATRLPLAPGYSPVMLGYANVPSAVLDGEWWRLVTAAFAHADVLHLALNLWALWSIGRLTERLYGNARYLCIYAVAGIVAGLVSIAWDPERWSIGASGAIFGVFGAFVAYLAHPASQVPRAIMRAHWLPTLLFVGFNLLAGALQQGIDNAAHVGGLVAGLVLGIALVPHAANASWFARRSVRLAAVVLLVVGTAAALNFARVFERQRPLAEQFAANHAWYVTGEARNLAAWQRLAQAAAAGALSEAQITDGFREEVLPFWQEARPRLQIAARNESESARKYRLAVSDYAQLRLDWVNAVVVAAGGDSGARASAAELLEKATKQVARIERLALISQMENSGTGLSRRQPFVMIRSGFSRETPECVRSPYVNSIKVAETDSRTDVPYLSDAAACKAQALFLTGDYRGLEELFETAGTEPDFAGKLSMAPYRVGLLNLFEYGPYGVDANLPRLVEWRRAFPKSTLVGPLEAELFSAWAWQARGAGFAREIPQQAWAAYEYRTEMALASLEADADAFPGERSALWYQAWLDVSVDTRDHKALLAKFAEAQSLYPRYLALHRAAIRALLPRWGGSHGEIMKFIQEQVDKAPEADREADFAQLMWLYADLDADQSNVLRTSSRANWYKLQRGFTSLRERYPDSDYLLNVFARLACTAESEAEFRQLRPLLESRTSATAWTTETTLAGCDAKYPAPTN